MSQIDTAPSSAEVLPPVAREGAEHRISQIVYALAWPVIVENLLQTALGVVDTVMVSRLGNEAVAGVGAALQYLFLSFGVFGGLAVGSTALVARFIGAGDRNAANRIAKQSIWIGLGIGLVLTVLGLAFSDEAMALLGPEPAVAQIGTEYLRVTALSMVFLVLMFIAGACLRGAGDTRTPMLVTAFANVVNAIAAYILIFGAPGIPGMGAVGSAWGTAFARAIGTLCLLAVLFRGRGGLSVAGREGWLPDLETMSRIIRIGIPSAIDQMLMGASFVAYSAVVITLGTTVFATMRITFNAFTLSFLPAFGFSVAAAALTGQALGARRPDRARMASIVALRSAAVWMTGMAVVFVVAGEPLLRLFTDDREVIVGGIEALRVGAIAIPVLSIPMTLAGTLRGAGDTRFPMISNLIGAWVLRLPIGYLLAIVVGLGLPGAYLAFAVDAAVQSVMIVWRYRRGKWQETSV